MHFCKRNIIEISETEAAKKDSFGTNYDSLSPLHAGALNIHVSTLIKNEVLFCFDQLKSVDVDMPAAWQVTTSQKQHIEKKGRKTLPRIGMMEYLRKMEHVEI